MPARKGGTYRTNDKGERELIERTQPAPSAPEPPAAPAKPAKGGK